MNAEPEGRGVSIQTTRDEGGRWTAEIRGLDAARATGPTHHEALTLAAAAALREIADRLERQEPSALALAAEIFHAIEDEIDAREAEESLADRDPAIPWDEVKAQLGL